MWLEILKKDLMKQKSVNIILFLFIMLSTIFLASSVNNICLVMSGLGTYMEYANVSDVTAVFGGEDDKEAFESWLDSRSEVTEYAGEQLCEIAVDDISTGDDKSRFFRCKWCKPVSGSCRRQIRKAFGQRRK